MLSLYRFKLWSLRDRLDLVYAGAPRDAPADRAFAALIDVHDMPRALPEALLTVWHNLFQRARLQAKLSAVASRATAGSMSKVQALERQLDDLCRSFSQSYKWARHAEVAFVTFSTPRPTRLPLLGAVPLPHPFWPLQEP